MAVISPIRTPWSTPTTANPSASGKATRWWCKTKYFEPNEHYIDGGIPISDQFEMTERFTMLDGGKTLQIDYTMTDPKMWKGEWKSTKRWLRRTKATSPKSECLPNLNENLPSTAEGQQGGRMTAPRPPSRAARSKLA